MGQNRYAFLMGANGPQKDSISSLRFAERDAERLATALTAYPCAFTKAEGMVAISREATLTQLKTFADQCEKSDVLIVHFSGHGIYDEQLYLIGNGTDIANLDASAISIDAIKRILQRCKARHKLLVLDCCYAGGAFSGPFIKGELDIKGVLTQELEGSASVILSACSRFDRAREVEILDGGAGFLSWVLLTSCTARFLEVSPDGCSLSLNDIWRWIPTALAEVNTTLSQTAQLPRPILLSQIEAGVDGEIWLTEARRDTTGKSSHNNELAYDRERFLKSLLADHGSFVRDRLISFVGREKELEEIRWRIAEKQRTGGYVTITGQAGQGKSSIIAKLVEEYEPESVAFHFIPFNPGPDHQVGLLRNLMARLILKYDLSDLYVASDSRAALRDYFPKVLGEVGAKGGREVIFIDGLDQFEAEQSGERDLSFLPNNPPQGIVFVLGTRPNDTLRPLELLKPHYEYQLSNLRREDFDLILQHRQVRLERDAADKFYSAMRGNALCLDLLAKELVERGTTASEAFIKQLSDNPEHLFSLTMNRLKRQPVEWREVIKPVLGVLLVAQEPVGVRQIRQLLGVDDDRLREGIERLGGLITRDWQQRYSLFHLKLSEYLRQHEQHPTKEYVFAIDEEQGWHKRLADWCEQGNLSTIWKDIKHDAHEQQRREYARKYYLAHLYYAREWQQVFEVLDGGAYGRAKLHFDSSTRLYAQDLNLGRQAAVDVGRPLEEGLERLPHLWRYTLLRCSLASRADNYTPKAFEALLLMKRKQEALDLAELLTDSYKKVQAFLRIAKYLNYEREGSQVFMRAHEVASSIEADWQRGKALEELVVALAHARQWERAEALAYSIKEGWLREKLLAELSKALALAQQWERAEVLACSIQSSWERATALGQLGLALAQAQQWERTEVVVRSIEEDYWKGYVLHSLVVAYIQIQQWEQAEVIAQSIKDLGNKADALRWLGTSSAKARQWERAEAVWAEAATVARSIQDTFARKMALRWLGLALAQAQQWERAEEVAHSLEESDRTLVLSELGVALAQAQQWKRAETAWAGAEAVARSIGDAEKRALALRWLGEALVEAQQAEHAERLWVEVEALIRSIGDSKKRTQALRWLGTALKRAQKWEQAEVVASSIEDEKEKSEALQELGLALVQAQQWERAEGLARSIIDGEKREQVIDVLVIALVQNQDWEGAEAVARSLEGMKERTNAMSQLVIALAEAQQWERAEAVWTEAEMTIRSVEDLRGRAEALRELGLAFAQVQQWEQADVLWGKAEAEVCSTKGNFERAKALSELGALLTEAKHWERAEAVLCSIEEPKMRTEALRELGTALTQAGQWERAEKVWAEALSSFFCLKKDSIFEAMRLSEALVEAHQWEQAEMVALSSEESIWRAWMLSKLIRHLAQAQQWERAENVAHSIEESGQKVQALSELGTELSRVQRWEQAEILWAEAEVIARSIDTENEERAWALQQVGIALARAGRWEQAEILWVEAEMRVPASKKAKMRTNALRELGTALTQAGQWERAEKVWAEAEATIRFVEDPNGRAEALRWLGKALIQAGQWERAERVWAEAEAAASSIQESKERARELHWLGAELAEAQQWERAQVIIGSIQEHQEKEWALQQFNEALVQAQQWERAEMLVRSIEFIWERAKPLDELIKGLAQAKQWERVETLVPIIDVRWCRPETLRKVSEVLAVAGENERLLHLVQSLWLQVDTTEKANRLLLLANGLIPLKTEIGMAFFEAFAWVDTFLKG